MNNIKEQIEQYENFHEFVTQKVEKYIGRLIDESCKFSFTKDSINVGELRYIHNIGDVWEHFSVPIEILF
jgi:hypothetical protein